MTRRSIVGSVAATQPSVGSGREARPSNVGPATIQPHASVPVPSRPSRSLPRLLPCDGHRRRLLAGRQPEPVGRHVRPIVRGRIACLLGVGRRSGQHARRHRSRPNLNRLLRAPPLLQALAAAASTPPASSSRPTWSSMASMSPVDVTSARDGSGRLFVVEQAGSHPDRQGRQVGRQARSSTSSTGSRAAASAGCSASPSTPTTPGIRASSSTTPTSTATPSSASSASRRRPPTRPTRPRERVLLHVNQPFANHNGGGVAFGNDGMLYISFGDGGSANDPYGQRSEPRHAPRQDPSHRRRAPSGATPYTVPPDNPFVGQGPRKPEIWLSGLRNPWRMRFDRPTGDLWIGDVGQDAWEEIDVARAGQRGLNYGWNVMEGFHCFIPQLNCDQTGSDAAGRRVRPRRRLRGHRRRRGPRPEATEDGRRLHLQRLVLGNPVDARPGDRRRRNEPGIGRRADGRIGQCHRRRRGRDRLPDRPRRRARS